MSHCSSRSRLLEVTIGCWAIDGRWCLEHSADAMVRNEGIPRELAIWRLEYGQAYLVSGLVAPDAPRHKSVASLRPFTGVFPLDPWKPDPRQVAQQALFLCCGDVSQSFAANLPSARQLDAAVWKLEMPYALRNEILERLCRARPCDQS
jgi:hypothetical protein